VAEKPEERARRKIDRFLKEAGWDDVSRQEYVPRSTSAVEEALMSGNTESDHLLFIENKAIAVLEARKESNQLGPEVADQAESYAYHPQDWYRLWIYGLFLWCPCKTETRWHVCRRLDTQLHFVGNIDRRREQYKREPDVERKVNMTGGKQP